MRFILLCYASRASPHHEMPRKKCKAALNYFSPQSSSKLFCCLSDGHIAALIVLNVNNPHLSHKTMKTSSIVLNLHLCICLKYKHIYFTLLLLVKVKGPIKLMMHSKGLLSFLWPFSCPVPRQNAPLGSRFGQQHCSRPLKSLLLHLHPVINKNVLLPVNFKFYDDRFTMLKTLHV